MDIEKLADFWLAQIVGVGPVGRRILEDIFGDILSLFAASSEEVHIRMKKDAISSINNSRKKNEKNNSKTKSKRTYHIPPAVIERLADPSSRTCIAEEYERVQKQEVIFIRKNDPMYPPRLKHISNPPEQLFVLGHLPDPEQKTIGIVGSRNCTPYGRDMARLFAYRLAEAGMGVISGMALGVDSWAHRGALEAGGDTFAVLGCGVEVCYPTSNEKIYRELKEKGGVISEYPTTFGALAQNFPMRNRIVSGLSDGILVIEARIRSGSLITADAALEQGKDVFAIPGRIGDELSVGCNRLIRQGAIPVLTPEDILEYYNIHRPIDNSSKLSPEEQQLLEMIGTTPVALSTLAESMQGSFANTHRLVMKLKKNRYIRETSRDRYIKI